MTIESQLAALTAQTQALDATISTELADVNTDLSAVRTRVTALEVSSGPSTGGGGGGGGTTTAVIPIVDALPSTSDTEGATVSYDSKLYLWNGTAWVQVEGGTTSDAPPGVVVVSELPTTAAEGDVVYNREDGYLYERTNGNWAQVSVNVNTSTEVADASLTVAKFATGLRPVEVVSAFPTTGNVAGRIVFLTTDSKIYRYDGTAYTKGTATSDLTGYVGTDLIEANAITTGKIQAGAVTASQIAADSINSSKIAAGSITSDKVAANAIVATHISTAAITSDKIASNSITAGKIAAASIGTSQLAAGAVTADAIAAGAITASKIGAGEITATKIAAGALTVDKLSSSSANFNGGTFTLGAGATVAGVSSTAAIESSSASRCAVIAANSAGLALAAVTATSGSAAALFYNSTSSSYTSNRTGVTLAEGATAGNFQNFTSGKAIYLATASYAYQTSGGASGTFTGAHDGLIPKTAQQPVPGDIVVDVANYASPNIYDTLHVNAVSSGPNQKGALGVMAEVAHVDHVPTALGKQVQDEKGQAITIIDPAYTDLGNYNMIIVNALGEGKVNVCGEGGNIEIGDLIVTSSTPGKGMKQADDCVRGYTVAKAREAVTFSSPSEIKQISCIYLAG